MSKIQDVPAANAPAQAPDAAAATARRVLSLEAEALGRMASDPPAGFGAAVEVLAGCSGRVIVAGVGKSGHVARKIAATLASTGAPSLFVHPTEASHGDLGAVARGDAVLALSNSGETRELADLLHYCKRFSIPLIAITARPASTLGGLADIVLAIPPAEEACAETRAPTTSTTLMMALGDALAVALLERKGFTADDFQTFHPGGTLGAALKTVRALMHGAEELPLVGRAALMPEAAAAMSRARFGCVGVVEADGRLAGIVTDGDLRRHLDAELVTRTAEAVMTPDPITAAPDMLASAALRVMNERGVTQLFVTEAGRPTGLIHVHDFLRSGVM